MKHIDISICYIRQIVPEEYFITYMIGEHRGGIQERHTPLSHRETLRPTEKLCALLHVSLSLTLEKQSFNQPRPVAPGVRLEPSEVIVVP